MRTRGVLAVLAASCCLTCSRPSTPTSELSVILVTLDTTRADRIGAFGGTEVRTPNIDRVAAEGTRFASAMTQVPLTLPSHASILTGRYPASHGVRHNGVYRLRESEVSLAERLKEAGFHTAAFLGAFVLNKQYGLAQGFDTYDDIATDRFHGGRDNQYEAQRTAEEVNAAVLRWLDARPEGRFFLWVHYYDPHLPYQPPESPDRKLEGSGYAREISYVDSCLGDLFARLRKDGLLDRSILVVAGDHGESLGEHREISHGVFLYDGAVHVPLLIRAPGHVRAGEIVKGPVELVDVAPTVIDLLGLPPLGPAQGVSLAPRMEERADAGAVVAYAETLMPRIEFGWSELRMIRTGRFKYIEAPRAELYDLENDPKEERNLLENDRERGADMAATLSDWVARTTDTASEQESKRVLDPDEEARLRSLGYLGGEAYKDESATSRALPDPKDRIEEGRLLTLARDEMAAGRTEDALRQIEELLRLNPMNHLALTSRVQALVRLRRIDEAVVAAEAALGAAVEDAGASESLEEQARRALASVLWMNGRNAEAEKQYRLAVEMNKRNGSAPVFGGILLGAAGGRQEAMRLVQDVLARNPRDGMAVAAKFELELAGGDQAAALATARELADLRAGDADTLVKAGRLARDREDPALAARLFEEAARRTPNDPDILGFLGTARLAAGDLDGAQKALLAARRLRPKDPRAPFYLGNIALLRNDEKAARSLYAEALKADPTFTPPLINLSRWLAEHRRMPEAIQSLEDALRRKPQDPEAQRLLQSMRASAARQGGPS